MARKEELNMNRTTQLEWLHLTTTLFPPKAMFIFHHIYLIYYFLTKTIILNNMR